MVNNKPAINGGLFGEMCKRVDDRTRTGDSQIHNLEL